jgi:2,5-diketo-D-gluconate reductase A
METVRLNNGVEMPILGYGVYQVTPEECERCVLDAISVGYRSIDTAQAYYNEEGVGNAVRKCGVPREELFITTKVWISNGGYEKAKASIDESLRKLQSDYVDLLLIHQPFMITMVHTVPWKRLTRPEKLVPLVSAISIRTVSLIWQNFVRLNRR